MDTPVTSQTPPRRLLLLAALGLGCSGDDSASLDEDAKPVIEHYASSVHTAYEKSVDGAKQLQSSIDAFVAAPSAATLDTARSTWVSSRASYGRTEGFRFYDGPIDDAETGPEGRINAWPMDENYVDYTEGDPDAGIVNDTSVTISAEALVAANEQGGETNIATGWHAIEFLLWGQDLSTTGPGARPFEDYTTNPNADRRTQYLTVVTELLVADLESVQVQWEPGTAYAATLTGLPATEALERILRGIGALAGGELSGERLDVAYETKSQEDEHSCFSDNTHNDILDNFLSIRQVYLGEVGGTDGPGIDDLVASRDAELAERIQTRLDELESAIRGMPTPFDQAIQGDDAAPGRVAIAHIVEELRALSDDIVEVAVLFDIQLNVEI